MVIKYIWGYFFMSSFIFHYISDSRKFLAVIFILANWFYFLSIQQILNNNLRLHSKRADLLVIKIINWKCLKKKETSEFFFMISKSRDRLLIFICENRLHCFLSKKTIGSVSMNYLLWQQKKKNKKIKNKKRNVKKIKNRKTIILLFTRNVEISRSNHFMFLERPFLTFSTIWICLMNMNSFMVIKSQVNFV